ncbi:MAG: flagellar brake protein [Gammaproteobacteria bacterium]|nr:flagellar brake protein [Gammaproteobacteria bacterium]
MNNELEPGTSKETKQGQVDNYEQYLLHNRAAIIQKLKQLSKSKSNITAHFGGGKYTLLTQVVDVLSDKDLVVLDYGSNETINKKLLEADRVVFKAQVDGITAQFNASKFQKAKLHEKPAFACPIPDSILWVQRRQYYRVRVPLTDKAICELAHDDVLVPYSILDISIAGIALHIKDLEYALEAGMTFNNARLHLPDGETGSVNLEVVNQLPMKSDNPDAGERFGCQFQDISMDTSAKIQRYIYNIEQMNHRCKDD